MKFGISVEGLASRMARARTERAREQAIRAALDELARRARDKTRGAEPRPLDESAPSHDTRSPGS